MNECTCKPGTYENGWHEERCDACWEKEMDQWRDMLVRFREIRDKYRE